MSGKKNVYDRGGGGPLWRTEFSFRYAEKFDISMLNKKPLSL